MTDTNNNPTPDAGADAASTFHPAAAAEPRHIDPVEHGATITTGPALPDTEPGRLIPVDDANTVVITGDGTGAALPPTEIAADGAVSGEVREGGPVPRAKSPEELQEQADSLDTAEGEGRKDVDPGVRVRGDIDGELHYLAELPSNGFGWQSDPELATTFADAETARQAVEGVLRIDPGFTTRRIHGVWQRIAKRPQQVRVVIVPVSADAARCTECGAAVDAPTRGCETCATPANEHPEVL